jgi:hypothetical protein
MDNFCSKIVSFYCRSLSLAWTNTLTWTNTLAYYGICKLLICNVFMVQAPGVHFINQFYQCANAPV